MKGEGVREQEMANQNLLIAEIFKKTLFNVFNKYD